MYIFFFFNDTATTEIYTLSLHDALPISTIRVGPITTTRSPEESHRTRAGPGFGDPMDSWCLVSIEISQYPSCGSTPSLSRPKDRKSTRLNSSHLVISYAVFCLKKKHTRL